MMKSAIPLITAVLLGLAAVYAVSKTVKKSDTVEERKRPVIIALSDIEEGEAIQEGRVGVKSIPESAIPKNAISAAEKSVTYNQKTKRTIVRGDYILYSDLELEQSKSSELGEGQWGVPVKFADTTLLSMLHPGDDIAIVGTFSYKEAVKTGKNADAALQYVTKNITTVVYPRVSILEINGSSVLLSMPPQQAVALTAIQQKMALYPVLRKKKDDNALNRLDGGIFEDSALTELVQGLKPIAIPKVPSEIKE